MDLIELVVNARRMLVARFPKAEGDVHSATMLPIDPTGVPYGPANRLPVTADDLPLPAGAATSDAQEATNALLGSAADEAAETDTGSASVVALIKRSLQGWTTLHGKIPSIGRKAMSGSVSVTLASDHAAVPVSGALTDTQLRAASVPTSDSRHETHAPVQCDVTVTVAQAKDLATLIGASVPAWATAARLYIGSASGVVYSTDGTDPSYVAPDPVHGVPLDAYDRSGHPIFGAAALSGLKLRAMAADVKCCIELMG